MIANGSDWSPQPVTIHQVVGGQYEALPSWFSDDYDHHMGLAIGDVTGNGFDDVAVAVFAGRDQGLSGGGVKLYRGGPAGLDPEPVWLARGFAATSIALGDLYGNGRLHIVASCLSEGGTIQHPEEGWLGRFRGRARILENHCDCADGSVRFTERVIENAAARGCGDVAIADLDGSGPLDLIFAGSQTTVLFGGSHIGCGAAWEPARVWRSREEHPYSAGVCVVRHRAFGNEPLIASSRGLLSMQQLGGRPLDGIEPGILIHEPTGESSPALQRLAPLDPEQPEIPAGLATFADPQGGDCLIASFVDARSSDIRGAAIRMFFGNDDRTAPLGDAEGKRLPGALMGGRVTVVSAPACAVHDLDIIATSTAAWPPAGASGVWSVSTNHRGAEVGVTTH